MDAILQTTFWSAFSWMKLFEFRLKFHWSVFLRFQLTIFQHWFRSRLGAVQATNHYLKQWWLDYRRIYASLGLNELRCPQSLAMRWALYIIHSSLLFQRNRALASAMKTMVNLSLLLTLVKEPRIITVHRICTLSSVTWPTSIVICTGEQPLMFCVSIHLTHWSLDSFNKKASNFPAKFCNWWLRYLLWNCTQGRVIKPHLW